VGIIFVNQTVFMDMW